MESRFTTGTKVVVMDVGNTELLEKYIGQVGIVSRPLADNDVGVTFDDGDMWWFIESDLALLSEYDERRLHPGDLFGLFKVVADV